MPRNNPHVLLDADTLSNALTIAAKRYREDAQVWRDAAPAIEADHAAGKAGMVHPRAIGSLVDQFERQAAEVEALIELLAWADCGRVRLDLDEDAFVEDEDRAEIEAAAELLGEPLQ